VALNLCNLIDPENKLDVGSGPRCPLVILAFDESHILTDLPKDQDWTLFSKLCRTLHGIVDQPIFSMFLLTVGNFHHFSPETKSDHSRQIFDAMLSPLDPIMETPFDVLAKPINNDVSLCQVVMTDWIAHLGRPLSVHFTYFFQQ
jgi:hypothetical protein